MIVPSISNRSPAKETSSAGALNDAAPREPILAINISFLKTKKWPVMLGFLRNICNICFVDLNSKNELQSLHWQK